MMFLGSLLIASFQAAETSVQLAANGSELPLLSFIGFGVLVGGLVSAMRTRRTAE